MVAYIFSRLLAAVPILIGISTVSFIIILLNTCSQDFLPEPVIRLLSHF